MKKQLAVMTRVCYASSKATFYNFRLFLQNLPESHDCESGGILVFEYRLEKMVYALLEISIRPSNQECLVNPFTFTTARRVGIFARVLYLFPCILYVCFFSRDNAHDLVFCSARCSKNCFLVLSYNHWLRQHSALSYAYKSQAY